MGKTKPGATTGVIRREDLAPHPFDEFRRWFQDAETRSGLVHPNAMCLSTVDPEGKPEGRIVLLKGLDERGFVFYTNFHSAKARALAANPSVALTFHWEARARQVRVQGEVEQVASEEADRYFATRPRGSRLGAWASEQSASLEDRDVLVARMREMEEKFAGEEITRPPFWGGYRVLPNALEFWQEGVDRLHDRFRYDRTDDERWVITRLSP